MSLQHVIDAELESIRIVNPAMNTSTNYRKYDLGDSNKTDFGVNLSVRQLVPLGNVEVLLEPRFQLGLIKFSNSKQISFQFLAGLTF